MRDQLLVIDGKRLRGISNSEHITHVVEMFAAETRLTIAQQKVPEKSSEPAALPTLLDTVKIDGAIVSMDALYAHVSSTQQVLDRGADYIIGIKDNQPNLKAEVVNFFEQARAVGYERVNVSINTKEEKGHGRFEQRVVVAAQELGWLPQAKVWGISTLVEVYSERHVNGSIEKGIRYYASNREAEASEFAQWIRDHWSIENSLHFVLDVIFR
jgi:predicted transposase YbfD/YdcC